MEKNYIYFNLVNINRDGGFIIHSEEIFRMLPIFESKFDLSCDQVKINNAINEIVRIYHN